MLSSTNPLYHHSESRAIFCFIFHHFEASSVNVRIQEKEERAPNKKKGMGGSNERSEEVLRTRMERDYSQGIAKTYF